MNKYNFGYDLTTDHSNLWAFKKVSPVSLVLEIGSSNGRLTKHLKEDLNCLVDIIEYNEEAGLEARTFSRKSFLGKSQGNIENPAIIDRLPENEYDYIIFLDVLEHLHNPQYVLNALKGKLKESGHLLISIPNIAHNSVIINLLHNKFDYTKLGLLDDTHLHFYTNSSARQLIKNAGYYISEESATQKRVGDIEIPCTYEEIPREISSFLRTRKYADVYQLLFDAIKTPVEVEPVLETRNLDYTLYKTQVFAGKTEKDANVFFTDPSSISIEVDLSDYDCTKALRVDPIEHNCILRIEKAIGFFEGEEYNLAVELMNGIDLQNGEYLFDHDDPQIYFRCKPKTEKVIFKLCCAAFDTDLIPHIKKYLGEMLETRAERDDFEKQLVTAKHIIQDNVKEITLRDKAIEELKEAIINLNKQLDIINKVNLEIKEQNISIAKWNNELLAENNSLKESTN